MRAPFAPLWVRRTPGISCERPIRSTLVCFIPLFGGLVAFSALVTPGAADLPDDRAP
jgi:hypothetical protein